MLDVPIHRLMDDLSVKVATKLSLQYASPQSLRCISAHVMIRDAPQSQASSSSSTSETTLWVDRYRPKRFTDLLGDDRVHREVMSWVKEWDHCVFGKKKGKKRALDDDNPDEYRRPQERVCLSAGCEPSITNIFSSSSY